MDRLIIIAVMLAVLSGCTTTLYGSQTTGGGANTITTGSAVRGSTQVGNARLSGSFGTPPPLNAPGGQVTFGNSGSAVLMIGLAIAGLVEIAGDWFSKSAERREPLSPDGVSHTCSCYGWRPEMAPAPALQK